MERSTYSKAPEDNSKVEFFTGFEVEKTPAYYLETLFVVGLQPVEKVTAHLTDSIRHIYFGANQSFTKETATNKWNEWTRLIRHFLDAGYMCTLDFDVSLVEDVLECGLTENRRFIPQISVKIPYINLLGYNATLKIDDIDFDKSNPGVWCHRVHDLMDTEKFTDWEQYKSDTVIKTS
jgi:hypothetical protein